MSITMTTVILFAVFGVLLFLGVPISISIVASSIVTAMSNPVLGPDHLYHDAEDELRRGELLAACCAPVHSGRQHHE